jgi:hypothetical protein
MDIRMVLTSHDELGDTGRKTGFWLEEFAAPYFVFRDAGVKLTLASPKGGQPPIDPKSDSPENQTEAMARFKQNDVAKKTLGNTRKLADMKAPNHDTMFYVGGHGLPREAGMSGAHRPGQDVFRSVLPADIDWKPFAAFPRTARLAVVIGGDRLHAYPPGSVVVVPGDTYHFHWGEIRECVTQFAGMGPVGIEYRDSQDDPRASNERAMPGRS